MFLIFWKPLLWLSLCFAWDGNIIAKDLPNSSESKAHHSKHASFLDLHIVLSRGPEYPRHVIQAWGTVVGPHDIGDVAVRARDSYDEWEWNRFYVRLFIAPDTPMELVRSVQMELRKAGVYKVMYMTWVE
jgi:hypothetical protein